MGTAEKVEKVKKEEEIESVLGKSRWKSGLGEDSGTGSEQKGTMEEDRID